MGSAEDFTYLIGLAGLSTGITVAADATWKTLPELLADAKKRPGAISWGNVGAISVNRIYAERLAKSAGARFNMIPFKGGSEAFQALLGHHLDVYGDPGLRPDGARRARCGCWPPSPTQRLKRWPQVPTVKELGHDLVDRIADRPGRAEEPRPGDRGAAARGFHEGERRPRVPAHARRVRPVPELIGGARLSRLCRGAVRSARRRMLAESGFKPE